MGENGQLFSVLVMFDCFDYPDIGNVLVLESSSRVHCRAGRRLFFIPDHPGPTPERLVRRPRISCRHTESTVGLDYFDPQTLKSVLGVSTVNCDWVM